MREALHFRENGTFRIMQLTDTHFSDDAAIDGRTEALLRELIAAERPDFIIHTGDAVYGADSEKQLDAALRPLKECGIPWCFTFGNHDGEYAGNKPALFARLKEMPGCRIWHDDRSGDGLGNCYFPVYDGEGQMQWLLVCLDSGDYYPDKAIGGYAAVTAKQIDWYRHLIRETEQQEAGFSVLVFQHIPLPEFREVWQYETCYGMKREAVCNPKVNTGFFSAMVEEGHAKGLFAGHDHVNDYWGALFGIALGYGRMSGYGNYACGDYLRGCRMFEFQKSEPGRFRTYIRLENHLILDEPWVSHPLEKRD